MRAYMSVCICICVYMHLGAHMSGCVHVCKRACAHAHTYHDTGGRGNKAQVRCTPQRLL